MPTPFDATLDALLAAGLPAVAELLALLNDDAAGVRLKAAATLAKLALDAHEQHELADRVDALEQARGATHA